MFWNATRALGCLHTGSSDSRPIAISIHTSYITALCPHGNLLAIHSVRAEHDSADRFNSVARIAAEPVRATRERERFAKKAVDEFDGRLPDNANDMEANIPGIGRYSAGAICSIAYNQCVPVVSRM